METVVEEALADPELNRRLRVSAALIQTASTIVVTAGAGMGVDSGLPDFRGNEGFWKAVSVCKCSVEPSQSQDGTVPSN